MANNLVMACDSKLWSDLSLTEKFKMQLISDEDPAYFWEHPALGNMKLWPSQKELLREFCSKDETGRRKFKELLLAAGMRSGKSAIAALIILTELKSCLMMDSAQVHYDLLPMEEITFLATASTEKQCHRTIFKKVEAFIQSSPFFSSYLEDINDTIGRIEFPGHLVVLGLGSNIKSNVGMTVKVFVAEEINFTGEETYKVSPKDLYNRLSKSTTTFKPFGEDIKVAISSAADGNDFLSTRIKDTREQKLKTTLIVQKTTLEMNPNLTKEDLNDEFLMDPESAENDYGMGGKRVGNAYFKQISIDKIRNWNLQNIFYGDPQPGKNKKFIPDLRLDLLKYDPNAVSYGILSDPASVGDGFGLALAHLTIYDQIIFDGLTVFKPGKKEEIDPKLIGLMVKKIIDVVPVEFFSYDIYMYNELRSDLSDLGIILYQHQLRLPDWEAFKERINTDRINGPYLKYFDKEFGDLKVVNGKVDHPAGGSKDMIDAACQAVAFWDDPKNVDRVIEENQVIIAKGVR